MKTKPMFLLITEHEGCEFQCGSSIKIIGLFTSKTEVEKLMQKSPLEPSVYNRVYKIIPLVAGKCINIPTKCVNPKNFITIPMSNL